jgi:hypothetical protein
MPASLGSWAFWSNTNQRKGEDIYRPMKMIKIQGMWMSLLEWIYTKNRADLKEVILYDSETS